MVRIVNEGKLRAVVDGELFTANTAAELVHLLNVTARFRVGPDPSDAEFMREAAERVGTLQEAGLNAGSAIRYDTPEHFIWDLRDAGLLALLKREIVPGRLQMEFTILPLGTQGARGDPILGAPDHHLIGHSSIALPS